MNREEQKYLIALGNLQNMAIDNTKGSKAVEICANDIRTYVERLNNNINATKNCILKDISILKNRKISNKEMITRLEATLKILENELKGEII